MIYLLSTVMGMSPKQRKSHIQAADCYKSGKSCLLPVCQNRAVAILKKKFHFSLKTKLITEHKVEDSLEDQAWCKFKLQSWFKSNLSMQMAERYQTTTDKVGTNLHTDFNET